MNIEILEKAMVQASKMVDELDAILAQALICTLFDHMCETKKLDKAETWKVMGK